MISKVTHDKFSASKVKLMVVFSTIIIVILSIIRGQLSNNENLFLLANNKSYQRTDSYVDDNNEADKVIHLSFDDVIGVFEELKEKDPNSIFELNTFGWLKDLHEKYRFNVSTHD